MRLYDCVRLKGDFPTTIRVSQLPAGTVGTIVHEYEKYPDVVEVEFSEHGGCVVTMKREDLELIA